jgi:Mrp family chromosome partitioning ATPase
MKSIPEISSELKIESIETKVLSSKKTNSDDQKVLDAYPFQLMKLPGEVINDFQRLIENIRSRAKENDIRVIGITSAVPGQGSSTVAALLSLMIAGRIQSSFSDAREYDKINKNVRLNGTDNHSGFEAHAENALYEIINNKSSYQEVMEKIDNPGLKMITTGAEGDIQYQLEHQEEISKQRDSSLAALMSLIVEWNARRSLAPGKGKAAEVDGRGEGVLLMDTQVIHPTLHSMFEMPVENGLHELVSGRSSCREVTKTIDHSSLKLITAGRSNGFQYTQKHLEELKIFLNETMRRKFEFVFLDIPPILRYGEGLALSNLCDGVIIVVSSGSTRLGVVREAKHLMDRARVPVIGAVLNRRKYFIPDWIYRML